MVRNYVKKRPQYNKEDMEKAIKAVKAGEMGYKKAASIFNVKRATLKDHVKNRYERMGNGRTTYLTKEEKDEIEECLKIMARWGFGFTQQEALQLVGEYASSRDSNPFKNGLPSVDWLHGFFLRHPTLTRRLPEQLKAARAKSSANETIVQHWFALVQKTLEENNLMNSPHRIYNVDETGLPLDPKRIRVICEKNISHLFRVIGGSGRDSITVNGCARADGVMLPPYVIYAAKNLRSQWMNDGPENCRYTTSDRGWMDSVCFLDWFEKLFVPSLSDERPIVLIFDGHKSHLSVPLIKSAVKNQVILLKLPPNSTHTLQPLDVGVYGPLKTEWEKILISFARQNLGAALTKEIFPSLLRKLWTSGCLNKDNITAGFSRCGIFPFNQDAVPCSHYESASIYDKVAPADGNCQPSTTSTDSATSSTSTATCPSTSSSSESTPSTSGSAASCSAATTPIPEPSKRATIKDYFMKKISPHLLAKREQSNRKTVNRPYGESLTSLEFIKRMTEEEENKTSKGKGKRKAATTKTIKPAVIDSESELDFDLEDDRDEDWVPKSKQTRKCYDSDSDSDIDKGPDTDSHRNIFKDFK